MNEPPVIQVVIDDFEGMFSNADPKDVPMQGAQVQVNVGTVRPGELTVRGGLREVTFDTL
jgi:hypothetical protein